MSEVTLSRRQIAESELPVFRGISLGDITLVDSVEKVATALASLLSSQVVGFDTESKPTFRKGEVSTGPHLVQLATDKHVFLFPVSFMENHAALKQILAARNVLKVGFGLGNDRSALRSRLDIELDNVLDLGEVLRGSGHRGTVGAKVAVAHYFGEKLIKSKRVGTSNWASRRLDERQMLYAANDAHVALKIYQAWSQDTSRQIQPAVVAGNPQETP